MRQSATAAAQGLRRCMALSQPGVTEHRLAAAFGEAALGSIDGLLCTTCEVHILSASRTLQRL